MKTRFMLLRTVLTVFTMLFMAAGLLAQPYPGQIYFYDFEANDGGWTAGSQGPNNNWYYGIPDGNYVNATNSTKCWFNGEPPATKAAASNEVSWITSPMLNFSSYPVDPVFRMKLSTWASVSGNGLALYYSLDNVNWFLVGSISDPNWYNTAVMNILGGNGWSLLPGWNQYERVLNGLAGESQVWLRIYFAGYTPATPTPVKNAFGESAIDDVLIYEPFNAWVTDESQYGNTDFVIMRGQCILLGVANGGGVTPLTIQWSDGQTLGQIEVCPLVTTTYYATVTDASQSKGSVVVSATVVVVDTLTVSAEYDGYTVCDTANTTLYARVKGGTPPYTYAWSPTDALSPTNAAEVVSTTNISRIYTVTVTDANGFTATDIVDITVVSGNPWIDIIPNVANVCETDPIQLTAYGGVSYVWTADKPGAYISNPNIPNPFVLPEDQISPTRFYVTSTSPCGVATAWIDVNTIPKPPVPTFVLDVSEVCIDDAPVALTGTFIPLGGTLEGTYPEFNDGLFYPAIAGLGTHYITYTVTGANGCTNYATESIEVLPLPAISIGGDVSACAGEELTYTYTFNTDWDYIFAITNGTLVSSGSGSLVVEWGVAGAGQIQITVVDTTSSALCDDIFTYNVNVLPNPITEIYLAGPLTQVTTTLEYCEGEVDSLIAIQSLLGIGFGPWSYNWTVNGGYYANTQQISNTAVYNANPYEIVVSVVDLGTTCSTTDTIYVRVYKNPAPEIAVVGGSPSQGIVELCFDECVDLEEVVDTYTSYAWTDSYGANLGTTAQIQICGASYAEGDTFKVYVTAGENGCYTTDSITVVIWALPEVFTIVPNGDAHFCWETAGVEISLDSSVIGINYALYHAVNGYVMDLDGINAPLSFGLHNIAGSYYIKATDNITGCVNNMAGTAVLIADTIRINIISEYDWVCPEFTSRLTFEFLLPPDTTGYGPWTLDWEPDARLTPDGYGAVIARPLVTTDYTLEVTGNDPLCKGYAVFNLVVKDGPDALLNTSLAPAFGDTAICLGSSIDLIATYTLGDAPIDYVVWSPLDDLSNIAFDGTTATATATPTVARTYVVAFYDENGCRGTDTVNVTVNDSPIVNINNGNPVNLCPGYSAQLNAIITSGSGQYTYLWSTTETAPSITVSPLTVGTTTYSVTVYDAIWKCYGYASIDVNVYDGPTIVMNGPLQSCNYGELNFNPTVTYSSSLSTISWIQTSGPQALPALASTLNPTLVLSGVADGAYSWELTVIDANGCSASGTITANIFLTAAISAGPDKFVCEGDVVTLSGSGGGTYEWYNAPGYLEANRIAQTATVNVSPTVTTTYYLRVNNNFCGVATSQVTVYVHPATPVFFDGLATKYCEVDAPVQLTNISPVGGTFSGEGVDPVTGIFDPGAVTSLNTVITITYTYADNSGNPPYPVCEYEHSMITTVYSTPKANIGSLPAVCASAASFPMTDFSGTPAGGKYYIDGVEATTFDPGTGAGTFTIKYHYIDPVSTCDDSAFTTFTVYPLPVKYVLSAVSPTDGNYFCDGDSATLFLSGSEYNVTYYLFAKLSPIAPFQNIVNIVGTGSPLNIGKFAAEGFYYLLAINQITGCEDIASDTLQLFKRELPQQYDVLAENYGHYCADGACLSAPCNGINISMFSTNSEDWYYLYRTGDNTPVSWMRGSFPSGAGKTFPGGPFTIAGEYYVIAIDTSSPAMCPREMNNRVTITIDPKPIAKTITVPALCHCPGFGTPITVVNTEVDVDYVLYFGGVALDTITGNGSDLSFAPVSTPGVYNVKGIKYNTYTTCVDDMLNTVTVCQYEYVQITGLSFPDLYPPTPLNIDITGGSSLTITATSVGDYGPGYMWQVNKGAQWDTLHGETSNVLNVGVVDYPSMKNWKYRVILQGYCNNDTSDVLTLVVRPDVRVYAGLPTNLDDEQCADTILIPIYVENFDSISSISLTLQFDHTQMTFIDITGTHPAYASYPTLFWGSFSAGKARIGWFDQSSQVSIGDAIFTYARFLMPKEGGFSTLTWDLVTQAATELTSLNYTIDATYYNGSITGWSLPIPNASIYDNPICEGDELFINANPFSDYSNLGPPAVIWQGPNGFFSTDYNNSIPNVTLDAAGDYTLTVIDYHGCSYDTTITVVVNPLPQVYNVTGGGEACVGSAVEIGLDGSEVDVKYTLMHNGVPYFVTGYGYYMVMGNGGPVTFGPVTLGNQILGLASFTVYAQNMTTGCDIDMNGSASVVINPLPFKFNVRVYDDGFNVVVGDYCDGGSGLPIKVMGSEMGVRYYLYFDPFCCACGNLIVDSVAGTGSVITFANQTQAGYYYVIAKNLSTGCETEMFNCVQIKINPNPIAVISGNDEICIGDTAQIQVAFLQGKAPYEIIVNGVTYSGITANPYVITVTPSISTTYELTYVGDANGCVGTYSGSAFIKVNQLPVSVVTNNSPKCVGETLNLYATGTNYSFNWSGPDGFSSTLQNPVITNVQLVNSGVYCVTVIDNATGCTNSYCTEVIINPLPTAIAMAYDTSVCVGEPICITGLQSYPNIVSYSWSGPNGFLAAKADTCIPNATLAMSGVYSLTVVDVNGCQNSHSVRVHVRALPVAAITGDTEICLGDTTVLTATGGGTYYWNTGAITASITVTPSDTTTYYVTVTNQYGCTDDAQITVNVNPLPIKYELTRDGVYCFGCDGIPINLLGSQIGVTYTLYLNNIAYATLPGTGSGLYWGDLEAPGTYTVKGVVNATGCENWMLNGVTITIRPAPTVWFQGDLSICEDECDDLVVNLKGLPPFTVHYDDGTIATFNAGQLTLVGFETYQYTIPVCGYNAPASIGINLVEDAVCFHPGDTAYITVLPLPNDYDLTGGGYYCNIGINVGLAGSQVGVKYILYANGVATGDTVLGTGNAISFGPQDVIGTYTVKAVNIVTGCYKMMDNERSINGGNLPYVYDITGVGPYCFGDSTAIGLSNSQIGVTYELLLNGIGTGRIVAGTGTPISFGYVTAVGTYTVQGIHDQTTCISLMNGQVVVTVVPLPTATIMGDASICKGDNATLTIAFTGMPPFSFLLNNGVTKTLYSTSAMVWTISVSPTVTRTYTVDTVWDARCRNIGAGSATVVVNVPAKFNITGGGTYCEGGAGQVIGLNGSEVGVTYELRRGGASIVPPVTAVGTGAAISFGLQTVAGVYNVIATQDATGCTEVMNGTVSIIVNPLPTAMNVTGGDSCCLGCTVIYLGLDSTEYNPAIRYELWLDGVKYINPLFPPKYGTGAAIEWGYMTQAGTYTILAVNEITGCQRFMNGSAVAYFFPVPTGNITGTDTICDGESTNLTITFTAGTPPFKVYVYNNDTLYFDNIMGNTFTFSTGPLGPGVHSYKLVQIADAVCYNIINSTVNILVKPLPTVTIGSFAGVCLNSPAQTLTGGLPAGGQYYVNGVPATQFDPSVLPVGTHTIKYEYTDSFGCTNSATTTRQVYELPVCTFVGGTYCVDAQPFQLTATPAGGTYSGTGVTPGGLFNPATAGVGSHAITYTYTNQSTGCTCSSTDNIIVIDLPTVTITNLPTAVCLNNGPVALTGTPVGGIFSGPGVTGNTFNPTAAGAGTHTLYYTYASGVCSNTASQQITVHPLPLEMLMSGGGRVCEYTNQIIGLVSTEVGIEYSLYLNNNNLSNTVVGNGGPRTFGAQSLQGTYSVYAYNPVTGCGKFMASTVTVSWIILPTVTINGGGNYCVGDDVNITFNFTGNPPFTFYYQVGGAPIVAVPNIVGYSHSITIPNVQNSFVVDAISIVDDTCYNDGPAVNVFILNPSDVFNVTGSGSYCAGSNGVAVGLDGSTAGVSYQLYKNGIAHGVPVAGTGQPISFGLQLAGTYTVITNGIGACNTTMAGSAVVVENPVPTVVITPASVTICAGDDVDLTASGALTYEWNTLETTATINVDPVTTTTYTVVGTNSYGCTGSAQVTVTVNPVPVVTINPANPVICDGQSVILTAGGAATYSWTGGGSGPSITVNPSTTTTYSVTGTNSFGCEATASVTVTVDATPTVTVTAPVTTICAGQSVDLTAAGAATYSWNTGATGAVLTVSPTTTTTYTVVGTTAAGCSNSASITITVNPVPVVSIVPSSAAICPGGNVDLTAQGATTYAWSTGGTGATINVTPTATQTYTVTGTSLGCEATAQVTVTVNPVPNVTITPTATSICVGGNVTLTAGGAATYVWGGGQITTAITVSPAVTTTYTVVGTSAAGCVNSASVTITVNNPPVVDLGADQTIVIGGNATLTPVITGGSGSYSYLWQPGGQTTSSITVSPATTTLYTVVVTDLGTGCTASDNVTVTVISVVGSISGQLTYLNSALTPMSNTTVQLLQGSTVVATTTTNASGNYNFGTVYAGSYVVKAAPTKPWGGVNSNDALLILKHFTNNPPLTGLYLKAADVNNSGAANATDALLVAQRFVQQISSFPIGDWVSDENVVTIPMSGGNVVNNFNVLCAGDVNGSFTPAAKASETVKVTNKGTKQISSYSNIDLPVFVTKDLTVGAISLVLNYNVDAIEVNDVVIDNASNVIFTNENGELRISWYNTIARQMSAGDALIVLKLRAKDLRYINQDVIEIRSTEESQIGNAFAQVYDYVELTVPKLVVLTSDYSISNFPNPFKGSTQFEYNLPENGTVMLRVFNMLGEQIAIPVNNQVQEAGSYSVTFDASNLVTGAYTYRFEVMGVSRQFSTTGTLVITK